MNKEPFVVIHKSDGVLYARLHDKQGNFTVYTVPEDCPKTYEAVQKQGKLVSNKSKGDVFRLPSGVKDPDFRLYNMIPTLEPVAVPKVHTFLDHVVYERETAKGTGYYVLHTSVCSCGVEIPGTRPVSRDGEGNFTRLQAFTPNDKAARLKTGSIRQWLCPDCVKNDKPLEKPAGAHAPSAPSAPLAALTPEQEARATVIKGLNWFKFQELDGHFYKEGKPIVVDKKGKVGILHYTAPCHKCKELIELTAEVTFKDGKPYMVGGGSPDHNNANRTKGGSHWVHLECPKKTSLKDALIKAAVEADSAQAPPDETPAAPDETPEEPGTPPGTPSTTALTLSLVNDLERISLDPNYNDDFVRGVTWAVLRMMKGGL